jgi:hypothetical protein
MISAEWVAAVGAVVSAVAVTVKVVRQRRNTDPDAHDSFVGAKLKRGPKSNSGAVALEEPKED